MEDSASSSEPSASANQGVDSSPFSPETFKLNWSKQDIEQRIGFSGGRFTNVNKVVTAIAAVFLTIAFYAMLIYLFQPRPAMRWFTHMFLERGIVPYSIVFFFFWSISILFIKARKLRYQKRALDLAAVPQQPDFVLTPSTARGVLERIYTLVDDTKHFVLLNRIERALSNLHNIGQISEVSDILRTQAEYDEEQVTSSYGLLNGFVWAIPVLGFVGTVLGLSQAISAFGSTLETGSDITAIKESLKSVTGGLANAFETTLIALVAALIVQLLLTFLQQKELEFLDQCNDYCHAHVVSKLRLIKNS